MLPLVNKALLQHETKCLDDYHSSIMSSPLPSTITIAKKSKIPSKAITNGKARTILKKSLQTGIYSKVNAIHSTIKSGRLPPDPQTFLLLTLCYRNLRQEHLRLHYANAALKLNPDLQSIAHTFQALPKENQQEQEKQQAQPEETIDDAQADDDVDHTLQLTNHLANDRLTKLLLGLRLAPVWTHELDRSSPKPVIRVTLKIPLDNDSLLPGLPTPAPEKVQTQATSQFKSTESPDDPTSRPHLLARSRAAREALPNLKALVAGVRAAVHARWAEGLQDRLDTWRDPKYEQRCVDAYHNAVQLVTHDRYAGLYGCRLMMYGSANTGMALAESDVDIALVLPGKSRDPIPEKPVPQAPKRTEILYFLEEWARRAKMHNVYVVDTARIPVLRYHDASAHVDVDITVSTAASVLLSRFIRRHLMVDARIWEVSMAVKYLAKRRCISGTPNGYINPIGWTIMVIFFLQHVVSPPIASLFRRQGALSNHSLIVRVPWRSSTKRGSNSQTSAQLLERFFQFFGGEFEFNKVAISLNCHSLTDARALRVKTSGPVFIEQPLKFRENVVGHVDGDALRNTMRELRRAHDECTTGGNAYRLFEERETSPERLYR